MAEPAVELHNVYKKFGSVHAVSGVTLSVNKGEIYSLIGPNGAGKTTIIKMIAGLLAPTAGVVRIFGKDIIKDPVGAKKYIGYIPDEPFVYNYLTGREFLELTGDLYSIERKVAEERIKTLLLIYNLEGVIDGFFSDFSRGNKQKTIIIARLLHSPKVLVIDEPIVGLDVQSQKITKRIFKDFVKNGGSILLCTHTLSVAQEITDRIGILKEGKLLKEGTLSEFRTFSKKSDASLEDLYLKVTGE